MIYGNYRGTKYYSVREWEQESRIVARARKSGEGNYRQFYISSYAGECRPLYQLANSFPSSTPHYRRTAAQKSILSRNYRQFSTSWAQNHSISIPIPTTVTDFIPSFLEIVSMARSGKPQTERKQRSALADVVSREYTIHLHTRVHGHGFKHVRSLFFSRIIRISIKEELD